MVAEAADFCTQAVCAQTLVKMISLATQDAVHQVTAGDDDRLFFLSAGAVEVHSEGKNTVYAAPHVFQLARHKVLTFAAAATNTVVAEIRTFGLENSPADDVPTSATMAAAAERMAEELGRIERATTVCETQEPPAI